MVCFIPCHLAADDDEFIFVIFQCACMRVKYHLSDTERHGSPCSGWSHEETAASAIFMSAPSGSRLLYLCHVPPADVLQVVLRLLQP